MKTLLFVMISVVAVSRVGSQEVGGGFSVERYSVIWQNSVFKKPIHRSSATSDPADWTLVGVFTCERGHGAVLINQKSGAVEQIEEFEPNQSGLRLLNVSMSDSNEATKVRVDHNGMVFWVAKRKTR